MKHVEVYGTDHSPWVQAVLLGLHEAKIAHRLRSIPPLQTFKKAGVMMPAIKIDDGEWQLESADILVSLGFETVPKNHRRFVMTSWRGLTHRVDSSALFWTNFSLAGDTSPSYLRRQINNLFRPFMSLTFFLLIHFLRLSGRSSNPKNFGDQFVPFEDMLKISGAPYLCGDKPNSLDFLLFGMVQSHCTTYVPPVHALQTDKRLEHLRKWLATMHKRFEGYDRLYSGVYFPPHTPRPKIPTGSERLVFWLGAALMVAAFPITVPLIIFLSVRNRMR
jgi:glutathione S-transferase